MFLKELLRYCFILVSVLLVVVANGQDSYIANYDVLLASLEDALEKGNPRALRELGGLLDIKEARERTISILDEHTIFPENQIRFHSNLQREEYFSFLNQYGEEISFSPIMQIFYTQVLEDYEAKHKIIRKRSLTNKEKSIRFKRLVSVLEASGDAPSESFVSFQLQEIAALESYESYDYLMACLEGKHLPLALSKSDFIEESICEAISIYDDPSILEVVLGKLEKGKLNPARASEILSRITNVMIREDNPKTLSKKYNELLDSLGTLSETRLYGFEKGNTMKSDYFIEQVDYYGYMLASNYMVPWSRDNAVREMMKTGDSRALFHLAGVLYAQFDNDFFDVELLEKQYLNYLNISIQVENEAGGFIDISAKNKDRIFYLNLAKYWASHCYDYEYDSDKDVFVNIKLEEENEESASRLFKKLTSENEKVALESFKELTNYPHLMLARLNEKYLSILRRAHPKLPDFRYRFLENLGLLNEFCEMEGIEVGLSEGTTKLLEKLKSDIPIQERYVLEDEIINKLELNEITGLEIEGLIHSKDVAFNFSISRILDIYYSKQFEKIINNELQVRLFLKKTVLFSKIGIGGICNRYPLKLEQIKNRLEPKLIRISKKEYDEDIRDAISYIMSKEKASAVTIPLSFFLNGFSDFDERNAHLVESPKKNELKSLFKKIEKTKERTELNLLLNYLSYHANDSYTPHLLNLLDNKKIIAERNGQTRTVADDAVRMLEGIYDFSFRENENATPIESAGEWLAFANKNKKVEAWASSLLEIQIDQLSEKEFILLDEINRIFTSPDIQDNLLSKALALLPKLESKNDVRKLEFNTPLKIKMLSYFKILRFRPKYLDDVLNYFEKGNENQLLEFSIEFIDGIPTVEKGKIYNRVCDVDGMLSSMIQAEDEIRNDIILAMNTYLDDSEFISEFEEKRVLNRIFILNYNDLPIHDKLEKTITYSNDPDQVYNIQQSILKEISLSELPDVIASYHSLIESKGESKLIFLENNFGLPYYLFQSESERKSLLEDLKSLEPVSLYLKYLDKSGLDINGPDGGLDYGKIRDVLEFDVVSPFSSTVSKNRSHYALGVMKLLELEFPEKKAESVIGNNLRRQASSWLHFLGEKGKLPKLNITSSFNHQS